MVHISKVFRFNSVHINEVPLWVEKKTVCSYLHMYNNYEAYRHNKTPHTTYNFTLWNHLPVGGSFLFSLCRIVQSLFVNVPHVH